MKKKYGLGTGFESLIPTDLVNEEFDPTREEDEKVSELREVEITKVIRDDSQPRKEFDEESLQELADSIKEHGILQPIVVTKQSGGKYQIVAGERRWRAAEKAGLNKVPVIVRTMDNQAKLEMMVVENLQRKDLTPIELATAYAKLKEQFNLSEEEIGKRVGKSASAVTNTMRLLKLPDNAKKAMQEHHLTEGPMRPLIGKEEKLINEVLPKIVNEGWSTRQVERYLADNKKKSSANIVKKSTFVKDEARLCKKYDAEVRIRARSVTIGVKNEEELRKLLEKL